MSNLSITYSVTEKRFLMPYTYATKRKVIRSVNPRSRTYRSLATQVLRARGRGQFNITWQNPLPNAILSVEGSLAECYLYRFENGNPLTITSGPLVEVLRYLFMLTKNGNPDHRNAAKNVEINFNVQ
jgi:hypothetical protein